MASKTTNYNLNKIDLTDAPPDITVLNENFDIIDEQLGKGIPRITATSTDGATYTATADKITALSAGLAIIIVPDKTSTTTAPTLNLNSLGAKNIRRKLSNGTDTRVVGSVVSWFYTGIPSLLIYDGTYWIAMEFSKPSAQDLYGTVPVANGGTGVTSLDALATAMGAAKVQTGSYTGTGTYGSSNPCSLTFDFVPKAVFIAVSDSNFKQYDPSHVFFIQGQSRSRANENDSNGYANIKVTWTGNTVSWYSYANSKYYAYYQFNKSNTVYYWIAIG